MAAFAAFRLECENLDQKNFRPVFGVSIPPNGAGGEILSAVARPIRTKSMKKVKLVFKKTQIKIFMSIDKSEIVKSYSQCRNIIWESMHNQHHFPWSFVTSFLGTAKHVATIVLNNASIRIHCVADVVFIPIPWVAALAAQ